MSATFLYDWRFHDLASQGIFSGCTSRQMDSLLGASPPLRKSVELQSSRLVLKLMPFCGIVLEISG